MKNDGGGGDDDLELKGQRQSNKRARHSSKYSRRIFWSDMIY